MKKIIAIGNALVDIITTIDNDNLLKQLSLPKGSMQLINIERLSEISKIIEPYNKKMVAGGSAANTICGISTLGLPTSFIGKIGNDATGMFFSSDLEANNVEPTLIKTNQPSGRCIALISPDGERTFCTYLGAACEMNPSDIDSSDFENGYIAHFEGYLIQNYALIETAMRLAKNTGAKISVDLASFNVVEDNREFITYLIEKYVDIVFANEEESFALTQKSPIEAADAISKICEIAVIKIGKKGSIVKSGSSTYTIDPIDAVCVDTTGAGDLYASGFLYGLSMHCSLENCGKLGSLLSGNVVEVYGAKMDESRWEKIKIKVEKIVTEA
ncbi:MAG: adenosine kinase [Paludibacteraceae bacterium]|nr:adenosine kinase [Paludibacteraceae bacterium]